MTNDLKPLEDRRKGYTPPEEALRILESMETKQEQPDEIEQKDETCPPAETDPEHIEPAITPPIIITPGFSIEDLSDRYRLHNIKYNGELLVVDWLKELLDKGNEHTLEKWIDLTKNTETKLADAPLYHATFTTLFHKRNHPDPVKKELIENVRDMFRKDFEGYCMITNTRVLYKPTGKDIVTHNKGYSNERTIKENITGPDGYINAGSGFKDAIDTLLGTRNFADAEQVYKWVTGKKPYLYRFNNKMTVELERPVLLGIYNLRFGIEGRKVDRYFSYNRWFARGVTTYRTKEFNKRNR